MISRDGFPPSPSFLPEPITNPNPNPSISAKRKRNLAGTPDPEAEVIALSPRSLMAKDRFVCDVCNKGFQRDQNLQLHRRGHNLPWKLKQRNKLEVVRKKVYVCPERSCVHHDPARALGDLTGVKKHFSRKHGEKTWKCEKCTKRYAVQSDWKAHGKICGTREYKCDCGSIFSRKDSYITHRTYCDAFTEENSRMTSLLIPNGGSRAAQFPFENPNSPFLASSSSNNNNACMSLPEMAHWFTGNQEPPISYLPQSQILKEEEEQNLYEMGSTTLQPPPPSAHMSATALLQKAAQIGSTRSTSLGGFGGFGLMNSLSPHVDGLMGSKQGQEFGMTRDFLGVGVDERGAIDFRQDLSKFACSVDDSSTRYDHFDAHQSE